MIRALLVASTAGFLLCACSPRLPRHPTTPPLAASQLAAARISSDDEYAATRADYDALPLDAPSRAPLRDALEDWTLGEAHRELAAHRPDAALDPLRQTLTLRDASELNATAPPDDERLAALATELEKIFRRRGAHQTVLLTLAVERTLHPNDPGPRERWTQVCEWMLGLGGTDERAHQGLIDDLETIASVWPSSLVVSELGRLYLEKQDGTGHAARHGLRGDLSEIFSAHSGAALAFKLAALYLRVSQPDRAIAALRKLEGQPGTDDDLRQLLERYLAREATPKDAIAVAAVFVRSREQQPVAQRICEDAARRFPASAEPWLCAGEIAEQLGHLGVAIRAYEAARRIDPARWDTWESLAKLYQAHLFQTASSERLGDLEGELKRVESFHGEARKRFPKPLRPSLAGALFEVGRGYYNAGRIEEAVRYCGQSLAAGETVFAFEQLALIAVKRGQGHDAAELFRRALAAIPSDARPQEQHYWHAKLDRGLGDALDLDGNAKEAESARRRAINGWEWLLHHERMGAEESAEAEVERGKLLYLVGERDPAIQAMERAIDAAPDRGSTYADLLAFLVPRGEHEEALDAYHRALGRAEVNEYLKVYCTLWMLDLDRRVGEPEDPLGRAFLDGVDGGKWYHELARWASGREADAVLESHADTAARRAEAAFYRAMRLYQHGQTEEARALWRKVLDTQMMAFFEYDMAAYYLRRGPAKQPALKSHPEAPSRSPATAAKPQPDGSI